MPLLAVVTVADTSPLRSFFVLARSLSSPPPPSLPPTRSSHLHHSQKLSPQTRLFKSLKLWSFYVDLEESIGTIESTKAVYDKIFELKIANAQIVINFANFLEENEYWEESFKVSFGVGRWVRKVQEGRGTAQQEEDSDQ